jgi:hypothetical protein
MARGAKFGDASGHFSKAFSDNACRPIHYDYGAIGCDTTNLYKQLCHTLRIGISVLQRYVIWIADIVPDRHQELDRRCFG